MQNSTLRSLSGLGALVLAATVWGEGHIDAVSGKAVGENGATITIVGHDLNAPKVSHVGRYYILQFDAGMDGGNRKISVDAGGVGDAKLTWYSRKPLRVRLTMHLDGPNFPTMQKTSEGYSLYFGDAKPTPQISVKKPVDEYPDHLPAIPAPKTISSSPTVNSTTTVSREMSARVSLDFVNTDVVQILKALALQANVNIVTSPEVSGKLTVSLGSVPLQEALDLVTSMAGVRYTKMGNTYVVTSAAKFSETVQMLKGNGDLSTETRVVSIYSHQGAQVKAALLQSVPVQTLLGKYDLLLSSEDIGIYQQTKVGPNPADGTGKAADSGSGGKDATVVATKTNAPKESFDNYMVIVGTPTRLDEVENAARKIDERICAAMGVKIPTSNGIVQRSYEPRGIAAEDLVASLRADKGSNFGDIQMVATPRTSLSKQVVVISGRSNEVDNMMQLLSSMDSLSDGGPTSYEVVGLKFIKPQIAMVEVIDAVPGIRAKLMPGPVEPLNGIKYTDTATAGQKGNSKGEDAQNGGSGSGSGSSGGQGSGSGSSGGSGSGGSGASGGSGGSSSGGSNPSLGAAPSKTSDSVSAYSADVTSFQTPMKLLLKGTPQQLEDAKRMLEILDVAPKQVALEFRVMELSNDQALQAGLDLSALTGGSLQSIRLNNGLGPDTTAGGVSVKTGFKGGGILSAIGTLDSISTKNNVIARPSILASDGSLTHIFVGDEVRYVESIISSGNNGPTITTGEVNVGVDFYVLPRIGADGNITLDLRPTFRILQGFTDVPGGGKLPQTSSRMAETLVNMKSGETIAIGGLIQNQDRKVYGGLPILKDLPIIGRLFGRTNNDKVRSEVVFFITAREVTEKDRQSPANPRQAEKTNKTWPGGGPNDLGKSTKGH